MKAAIRDRYGPPEVVEIRDVDRPLPEKDQVLVRVRAASVNRADLDNLYPRWQFLRLFLGLRRPRIRTVGSDVAGVVESVGPSASRFRPGDEVFADLFNFGQGAFAEYVCAPERAFATIPPGMSFEEAATLPHSAILALQGLRLRSGRTVKPGDKVLVVGASGNVGPFAVQIAKSLGAEVSAVASGAKLDFVRSLGADHVIDYTLVDPTRAGRRYDWIIDVEARHSIFRWRSALGPRGVYVTLGGPVSTLFVAGLLGMLVSRVSHKWTGMMFWWKPFHPADVATLKELIAAGKLKATIDRTFPLGEVVEALRRVDDGKATGKVVITV
jgi:NADPH:quinone reductase-like Zn-dependent oxidoreductase